MRTAFSCAKSKKWTSTGPAAVSRSMSRLAPSVQTASGRKVRGGDVVAGRLHVNSLAGAAGIVFALRLSSRRRPPSEQVRLGEDRGKPGAPQRARAPRSMSAGPTATCQLRSWPTTPASTATPPRRSQSSAPTRRSPLRPRLATSCAATPPRSRSTSASGTASSRPPAARSAPSRLPRPPSASASGPLPTTTSRRSRASTRSRAASPRSPRSSARAWRASTASRRARRPSTSGSTSTTMSCTRRRPGS